MNLDCYGPSIDCNFQKEGKFGPPSSRNFNGDPTLSTLDIKIWYIVKRHFLWPKLKAEIAMFIMKCQEFELVKVEHHHPSGFLQPLPIPEWKWEVISMDFITGIPKRKKKNDYIFIVVDNLSKAGQFILIK